MKHVSHELRSTVVAHLWKLLREEESHTVPVILHLRSNMQSPVLDACNRLGHPISVEMRDER